MCSPLIQTGLCLWKSIKDKTPWTQVYGLSRTLLALGTLLTLAFNEPSILFRPASGIADFPICQGPSVTGLFCLLSQDLELARWLAVVILLVVALGWRPRYTAIFHWWVSFSLQTSAITVDGGDQVTSVLTFLLLPVAITDRRTWHWSKIETDDIDGTPFVIWEYIRKLLALSALLVIRLQVSIIYFHAATSKLSLDEWIDGTILYYWFSDPVIGLSNWLQFLMPIFRSPFAPLVTWLALLIEFALFMGLIIPKRRRIPLLFLGVLFHIAIAVTMGLISFGFAMCGALILYLWPIDLEFEVARKKFVDWFSSLKRALETTYDR